MYPFIIFVYSWASLLRLITTRLSVISIGVNKMTSKLNYEDSSIHEKVNHIISNTCLSVDLRILEAEPKWFERGVRESIKIRINSPTLNKDAGRYNLPPPPREGTTP